MQNIKTGIVVALLLAVCYGAFKALNEPEAELPPELNEWVSNEGSLDALLDDVELGDNSSLAHLEPDVPQIPGAKTGNESSLPEIALPSNSFDSSATKSEPKKTQPANPNSLLLDTTPPSNVSKGPDGPAVKVPSGAEVANLAVEQDSLVPETLPLLPESDVKQVPDPSVMLPKSNEVSGNVAPGSSADSAYPSIPLPGANATSPEQTKAIGVSTGPNTNGSLPLLPDASAASDTVAKDSTPAPAAEQAVLEPFASAREKALALAKDGKLKDALILLTPQFRNPVITSAERSDLLDILDALAREVIFSKRHLLKPAYTASATDTVESVATAHKISPELLTSINQLGNAKALVKGQELKVIEGPFRGEVDLNIGEVTLFLNDMYACRFPITTGTDPVKVGSYEVADKRRDRTYFGAGKVIEASNPSNPYGGYWIDLGHDVCLHGSPEMETSDLKNAGCISLAPQDIADAYIMLTQGSQLTIRR